MHVDAVFEERYWYPDDGSIVWLSGYAIVDDDGRYLARDAPELAARGLIVASVAGAARHHGDALASDAAAPGSPLELRRDPTNEHDPDAIAVDLPGDPVDAVGEQLGWVPREVAARIAPELDAGSAWSALSLRESRPSPRDPRAGLTMLLARADSIELRDRPRSPPPRA
jgi:HIRAN domain-containing protein